jgi:hypothetical protein
MKYVTPQRLCKDSLLLLLNNPAHNFLFSVYSLFSALIMHVYQMRSYNPTIVSATQERIQVCMDALKEVSKVWLVAKMVHTLFMSILGNKNLEERLQKAAGKRHKKARLDPPGGSADETPPKAKLEDFGLGYAAGPPAHQVSFERSRPQSPAVTPSRETHPGSIRGLSIPNISPTMQHRQQNDNIFLAPSQSRGNTRPGTPFNAAYSMPASPPDLYLVTRDSPNLSSSLWENFQPDQLFPENIDADSGQNFGLNQSNLDPQLQMPGMATPTLGQVGLPSQPPSMSRQRMNPQSAGLQDAGWTNQLSPEDSWSNSSVNGQPVPTTLNVEDW